MQTTTLRPSLGLAYLDEQQRFRPNAVRQITKSQPAFSDIRAFHKSATQIKSNAKVSASATTSLVTEQPVLVMPAPDIALESPIVTHNQTAGAVFAEQFTAPLEAGRNRWRRLLPIVVASLAVAGGLAVLGFSLRQSHQGAAQVAAISDKLDDGSGAQSDAPPSESPVVASTISSYKVAPDMPKTITIKAINVHARVLPVGILSSGALGVPRNTNDTGWYNGSSKPGENGAPLIIGHVSGAVNVGVFYNLKKLNAGDIITVERGDGVKIDYKVVKKQVVPSSQVDMSELLVPVTAGTEGLNIMTCAGKYQEKEQTFTDRELVFTERV